MTGVSAVGVAVYECLRGEFLLGGYSSNSRMSKRSKKNRREKLRKSVAATRRFSEPVDDQLKGIYYQAVERQRFDVAFVRVK
jgi:hypothetical protein